MMLKQALISAPYIIMVAAAMFGGEQVLRLTFAVVIMSLWLQHWMNVVIEEYFEETKRLLEELM